ncbi:MAG: DUF4892 domain-containing protein [Natronospirillum sp.]|uniref:DUF4892 domain-containing protein n=1 Tax=Natronospirillum sp. TaxID=2812955 RepID=UPI0025FAEFA3|nr:DUF4892 domain-containing protein [Natronospirillum sp.]MCH8551308.1 DUF4892 domain-containing protein [Natronospirillum sp.]
MRSMPRVIALLVMVLLAASAQADLGQEALRDFQPNRLRSEGAIEEPHRYWWVRSALRRIERDFAPDDAERVDVLFSRWQVIEIDRAHDQADVFEQVRRSWKENDGYQEIFHCEGNSCGTSQHWANEVFNESILYGLNRHQHYSTGTVGDDIRVLYAVRRGTQLNYVYWLEAVRTNPAGRLASDLRAGEAILASAFPAQVWAEVLDNQPDWELVLVGHDYSMNTQQAIDSGRQQAERFLDTWVDEGIDSDRVRVESVGYLAPRVGLGSRVTVVLPPQYQENQ